MTEKQRVRLSNYPLHNSQRGYFAFDLYKRMVENENIYLITGDLGFGMFTPHMEDIGDRCINVGAAEQAMVGVAVGLALEGKVPFVFSITSFLLARPYEWLRNYVNNEKIPVRLIGTGRDKEYEHDGFTHDCSDAAKILSTLPNIVQYWPEDKKEMGYLVSKMVEINEPSFISLKRKL